MSDFDKIITSLKQEIFNAEQQAKILKQEAADAEKYARECKAHIINMMQENGVITMTCDGHKITTKNTPTSIVIEDESLIPPEFMNEEVKRSPNKKLIKEALDSGYEIKGVSLTRSGYTLQFTPVK